jgi:hypothetical protein
MKIQLLASLLLFSACQSAPPKTEQTKSAESSNDCPCQANDITPTDGMLTNKIKKIKSYSIKIGNAVNRNGKWIFDGTKNFNLHTRFYDTAGYETHQENIIKGIDGSDNHATMQKSRIGDSRLTKIFINKELSFYDSTHWLDCFTDISYEYQYDEKQQPIKLIVIKSFYTEKCHASKTETKTYNYKDGQPVLADQETKSEDFKVIDLSQGKTYSKNEIDSANLIYFSRDEFGNVTEMLFNFGTHHELETHTFEYY